MVQHIIICWLKEPQNQTARDELIAVSKKIAQLPGIVAVTVGTVLPSKRAIVDSSFDIAIIMSFENEQSLLGYLNHPRHKQAVKETLQPLTKKVVIYDMKVK